MCLNVLHSKVFEGAWQQEEKYEPIQENRTCTRVIHHLVAIPDYAHKTQKGRICGDSALHRIHRGCLHGVAAPVYELSTDSPILPLRRGVAGHLLIMNAVCGQEDAVHCFMQPTAVDQQLSDCIPAASIAVFSVGSSWFIASDATKKATPVPMTVCGCSHHG